MNAFLTFVKAFLVPVGVIFSLLVVKHSLEMDNSIFQR